MCESGEKGGQEDDDETELKHSRISNQDRKTEGGDQTGGNMQGMRQWWSGRRGPLVDVV